MENEKEYDGDYKPYPPWIKLWASKYADFLDVDSIIAEYDDPAELTEFLHGMGQVFLNLLYAYSHYYDGQIKLFNLHDRYLKMLENQLLRDLKQTFKEYERRCEVNRENGKKGGRPPSNSDE